MEIFLGILSSGFVTLIISILANEKSKSKDRKSDFLSRQIQSLYGPLYFLFSTNQKIHNLILQFRKARDVNGGSDDFLKAIYIENDYVALIAKNNEAIATIANNHSDLIDIEDMPFFLDFLQNSFRLKVETDLDGKFRLPDLSNKVGDIFFIQPDLITRFEQRCSFKKKQMEILRGEYGTCSCNCDC